MVRILSLLLCLALAGPAHADPLKSLSKKIRTELKNQPISLGVLNFFYERGRMSTGSYLVSERLLTYLVQDGAIVVERRLLNSLLAEQRFAQIGITNIDSLKRVGKVLGVDAVVVGTLSDRPDDSATDIIARVIEVKSARVVAGGAALTPHEWPDIPKPPALPRSRVPVPDVSLAEPMTTFQNENQAIRLDPNEPKRTLGEHPYAPAPVPSYFSSSPQRVNKEGGKNQ